MNFIGIDIGGTNIKAGLVDPSGKILASTKRPTETQSVVVLLNSLRSIVEFLSRNARPAAVGLGIPGLRSAETGVIEFSPNMPCLDGVNLEAALAAQIEIPVAGRNDADMSAWGEFCIGAGVGTKEMICLTLGTGVGSGLILHGEMYNGSRGYAAEAGHMVVEPDGMPCHCGGRGCLETVASATGIVALARRRLDLDPPTELRDIPEPLTAETIYHAAAGGDRLAREVFGEAGRYLGIACANLINILNLDMIVVGGGAAGAGDFLLEPAITEARFRAHRKSFEVCQIVPARLGNDAGVVGAALFALHTLG